MASDNVPMAVRNWLRGSYPTLAIKDSWLAEATTKSIQAAPSPPTDPQLIGAVNAQLLNADLAKIASVAALPKDIASWKTGKLASGQRGAILLQVVGKLDIGVSAHAQLEVLEARRDARRTLGGAALLAQQAQASANAAASSSTQATVGGLEDDKDAGDHMAQFNAQEEAASLPATVFPRSMLQLDLSDGFTTIKGFEHQRIHALSMADTGLGAKLLLKNVDVVKGLLLLTPENTTVRGGVVEELEGDAERKLIDKLRAKLGKDPLPRQRAPMSPRMDHGIMSRSASRGALEQEEGQEDLFEEEEAIMAEMQAEQAAAEAAAAAASKEASTSGPRVAATLRPGAQEGQSLSTSPTSSFIRPAGSALSKRPLSTQAEAGDTSSRSTRGSKQVAVKGEPQGEDDDFVMMERIDEENPIVLSDSD